MRIALLAAAVAAPALAQEVVLTVAHGPGAGEVTLEWTGGTPPWELLRATDAAGMGDPGSVQGDTDLLVWVDAPPPADLVFYQVWSCPSPGPPSPHGCTTCGLCDAWNLHWEPVHCARSYTVRWKCGLFSPEQVWPVGATTSVADLCDIGMCDGACSSGIEYVRVQACNGSGCSGAAQVPSGEVPSICGGGCCFP